MSRTGHFEIHLDCSVCGGNSVVDKEHIEDRLQTCVECIKGVVERSVAAMPATIALVAGAAKAELTTPTSPKKAGTPSPPKSQGVKKPTKKQLAQKEGL